MSGIEEAVKGEFEGFLEYLLGRFDETIRAAEGREGTLSKDQLIGMYQAAAMLTLAAKNSR